MSLMLAGLCSLPAAGQRLGNSFMMGRSSYLANNPFLSYDWRPGMVNITETGFGIGLGQTDVPYSSWYTSVTNVTGYQFDRHIRVGVGYGLQYQGDGMLIPLYVDTRINLSTTRWIPFVSFSGGAALSPTEFNAQSRIFSCPSVGVRYIFASKYSVNFSTGLMVQAGGLENRSSFLVFKLGVDLKGRRWGIFGI